MPVLLCMLVGDAFGRAVGRVVLSHAFLTLLVWGAAVWVGISVGFYNIGPAAGYVMGALAPAALLAWTLWRPARSRAKLWMLDGLYVWARLSLLWFGGWAALLLPANDWRLAAWAAQTYPVAAAAAGCWAVQRALVGLLVRSHRREGDASVAVD